MVKELLYLGVGAALLAKDRVEAKLERLVEEGKRSKEEVAHLLEEAKRRGEEEEHRFREELKRILREVIQEAGVATKEDIEELKRLIER
ncbi:MAG: hypothetical protein C6I00_03985 [Nitratiruptor sp.]|nr:hypothetical protein [Nitratiruptor sp.]NPA83944.1 hypothetical protein [Campylobacterota bacterium]